ncbi:MAG: hypothetical protein IJG13_05455, partial [Kiritimatiellae bacterium]|nr:hypothetical protein [Kiritimatiellia bacterium]
LLTRRGEYACLTARIAGSGGVTFATPCDTGGNIYIGANTYSGGTWINGAKVAPLDSASFGSGTVRTGRGNGYAGSIGIFTAGLDFTNRLCLAGFGNGREEAGALKFTASSTWSGDVELVEPSRVCVSGMDTVATISGAVSGDRLQLFLLPANTNEVGELRHGTLRLEAANSYTGGTEIVRSRLALAQDGTLGTGEVVLDRGILRIENQKDEKTVPNAIRGIGTVELAGRGRVDFTGDTDLRSPEGRSVTLDVQSRSAMVDSLAGFSSVTSTLGRAVSLYVLDTTPFEGEVDPLVTILYGEQPNRGTLIYVK